MQASKARPLGGEGLGVGARQRELDERAAGGGRVAGVVRQTFRWLSSPTLQPSWGVVLTPRTPPRLARAPAAATRLPYAYPRGAGVRHGGEASANACARKAARGRRVQQKSQLKLLRK